MQLYTDTVPGSIAAMQLSETWLLPVFKEFLLYRRRDEDITMITNGNFLVVQWLGFRAFTRGGYGDRNRIANLIRELNLEIYYFMGLLMGNTHQKTKTFQPRTVKVSGSQISVQGKELEIWKCIFFFI